MNKQMYKKNYFLTILVVFLAGCASQNLRFRDQAPVKFFNDIHPIPIPESVYYNRFDYYATARPPVPARKTFQISESTYAKDVNSMDQVPASSWFIPRLGSTEITPRELLYGPTEYGPPQPPITIIRVRKPQRTPRLFVFDKRHVYYLLKFDPKEYPGIATTTSFIVNRLFWGFGYHVPEDHLFFFKKQDLKILPESNLTETDLDQLLSRISPPVEGKYRSISSRILEGLPLGPTPEKGVRADDPNDVFPHQDRRVLRALRVFCALTNMADIGPDNTLDMYVGDPGKGYIKHHIVDFDDAFGTPAARNNRLWAGFNHLFSIHDILTNFFTLGLIVQDWEKITYTNFKSVGSFESEIFQAENWKETLPYEPIRHSQPSDNYWAAKIIGALDQQHFETLVENARYPEPKAKTYIINTLMERKDKILKHYLEKVSPVEFESKHNKTLYFRDLGKMLTNNVYPGTWYHIIVYDGKKHKLGEQTIRSETHLITIHSETLPDKPYIRIDIRVLRAHKMCDRPAQFHFRKDQNSALHLVGVVH